MARLGDTTTGKWKARTFKHDGDIMSAAFSPDGKRVVTAAEDGTVILWSTPSFGDLIPLAKQALTRCLTAAERTEMGLHSGGSASEDRERITQPPCDPE